LWVLLPRRAIGDRDDNSTTLDSFWWLVERSKKGLTDGNSALLDAETEAAEYLNSDMVLVVMRRGGSSLMRKMRGRVRRLRREESGALEGLPLYLIILITITAIALVVIIGLIPRPLVPSYTTIDVTSGPGASADVLCWGTELQNVTVTVFTRENVPINDALVHLQGAGNVDVTQRTRDGGKAIFVDLLTSAPGNPGSTTINVEATFGGVTIVDQIPLNRAGQGGCP